MALLLYLVISAFPIICFFTTFHYLLIIHILLLFHLRFLLLLFLLFHLLIQVILYFSHYPVLVLLIECRIFVITYHIIDVLIFLNNSQPLILFNQHILNGCLNIFCHLIKKHHLSICSFHLIYTALYLCIVFHLSFFQYITFYCQF